MKIKGSFERFLKKHPKLLKLMFGEICPKCDTTMSIVASDYSECPKCGHKKVRR